MKPKPIAKTLIGIAAGLLLSTPYNSPINANDKRPKACSNKSLNGAYGFYRTGSTSAGPLAALGILYFDGNGTNFGSQSISRNGIFNFDLPLPPSPYEVAADCTGRLLTDTGIEVGRLVVVDGGNEFYLFSESAGNAVYGVAKKIHPDD
jgi:hypothetical protein